MNLLNFAEEYTRLVIRYTKASSPNNDLLENKPLTSEEIVTATHNVLFTICNENGNNNDYFSIKTLSNEVNSFALTKPAAQKINQPQNDELTPRFRSEDIPLTPINKESPKLHLMFETNRTDTNNTLYILKDDKKIISHSTPKIHIENFNRSDTFVCPESHNAKSVQIVEMKKAVLHCLKELQQIIVNYMEKLNGMEKQIQMQHKRFTSAFQTTAINTTCESSNTFSETLTSSKLTASGKKDTSEKRKSIGGNACSVTRKLVKPTTVIRSTSDLSLSTSNKPLNDNQPVNTTAKNLKYAHIQSTIPKQITYKKKLK